MERIELKYLKKILESGKKEISDKILKDIHYDKIIENLSFNNFLIDNVEIKNSIKEFWIENSEIKNSNFSGIVFQDTGIYNCKFKDCNFQNSKILSFAQETLTINADKCNFDNINIQGCIEVNGEFNNCNLKNAHMACTSIDGNFYNCNMEKTLIEGSIYAVFNETNLRGSRLYVENCRFINSDISEACLSGFIPDLNEENFKNTKLKNLHLKNLEDSVNINIENADLSNLKIEFAECINSIFKNCNLKNSKFECVKLKNSNFRESNLYKSEFKDSDLSNADFTFANLKDISFENSKLNNIKILEKDYKYFEKYVKKEDIILIKE